MYSSSIVMRPQDGNSLRLNGHQKDFHVATKTCVLGGYLEDWDLCFGVHQHEGYENAVIEAPTVIC